MLDLQTLLIERPRQFRLPLNTRHIAQAAERGGDVFLVVYLPL